MKDRTRVNKPNSGVGNPAEAKENSQAPTRRQFLQRAAGAGIALVGSAATAWANTHPHPSPQSINYLDRRLYIHNMDASA